MVTTGLILIFLAIIGAAAILAFEIWMFVDAVKNPRISDNERLLWCLGMLLIHPFVAIIYYFTARNNLVL